VDERIGGDRLGGDRLVQAIVLVTDLDSARRHMEALGLHVQEGGRHPGRGTANLIVAFGAHYLELLAVVDDTEALSSPLGRPVVAALARRGPGLARWSVEAADIDATAARVGLPVERRHRVLPDGTPIRWRSVGVDEAWEKPWRCAFMAWDDPDLHPARLGLEPHPNGATGFARIEVDVPDTVSLLGWTGGAVPDGVTVTEGGTSGPAALFLATPEGEIPIL
jgi:hypothetical protein